MGMHLGIPAGKSNQVGGNGGEGGGETPLARRVY